MPRIHAEFIEQGIHTARERVRRLMNTAGLRGVSRRPWVTITRGEPRARPVHLVQRHFSAKAPNQLWVADATYVPTVVGYLYLAVVLDVFSRRVVGWAIALLVFLSVANPNPVAVSFDTSFKRCCNDQLNPPDTPRSLRPALSRDGGAPLDGYGGRLLQQRHVRKLLATLERELLRVRFETHKQAQCKIF
ncbi:DDE-type integrase/transposase/recombinase [Caballeronia sp. DA-9]|uniref:DDE-type integrase/transposase/recombinase n=1 Tax=Caballeronia sp. DA-9 TaxID=3436237 RepID=UPI003F680411